MHGAQLARILMLKEEATTLMFSAVHIVVAFCIQRPLLNGRVRFICRIHLFSFSFLYSRHSTWLIITPILTHSYIAPNISRFGFVWQSLDILCQHKAPERHHHPTPHHIKTLKCHDAKEHTSTQYIHTLYESIAK